MIASCSLVSTNPLGLILDMEGLRSTNDLGEPRSDNLNRFALFPPLMPDILNESSKFFSGIITGLSSALIFHPYDQAIFLSIKTSRPFLSYANFKHPIKGISQNLFHRAISNSLYFPLEHKFRELFFASHLFKSQATNMSAVPSFLSGVAAGSINAVIINPLSAIRYEFWGNRHPTFFATIKFMYHASNSIKPFFKSTYITISRDIVFGGIFSSLRFSLGNSDNPISNSFIINLLSATVASIASSPFNFVRNVTLGSPPDRPPPSSWEIMRSLGRSVPNPSSPLATSHFIFKRLLIGWGTLRVALGMAFGASLYDFIVRELQDSN